MHGGNELDLTVQVSAADWGYLKRRLAFLNAVLIRVLRDDCGAQEWFSAAELASLKLPGLPAGKDAISRKAKAAGWARMRGGKLENGAYRYHVTHLPNRAFEEIVRRLLNLPDEAESPAAEPVTADMLVPDLPPVAPAQDNTTPAWVLPLMRLIKGEASGDLGVAWDQLPRHVPKGVPLPTVEEAAETLIRLGLAGT